MPTMNLETVKYIMWKFMLEQGHTHSAFTFFHESNLMTCPIVKQNPYTPRDALIKLLVKAGSYAMEMFGDPIDLESMGLLDAACKIEEDEAESETMTEDDAFEYRLNKELERSLFPAPPYSSESLFKENTIVLMHGHSNEGVSCQWHPTEDMILSTSFGPDSTVRYWTLDSRVEKWTKTAQILKHASVFANDVPSPDITMGRWSQKNVDICATGNSDYRLRIYNVDGRVLANSVLDSEIRTICWTPMDSEGPNYLACATQGGEVYVYDCTTPSKGLTKAVQQFEGYTGIYEMHFLEPSPGHLVFHYNNRLFLHSAEKEDYLRQYLGHKETILGVRPCPGHNAFASSSADCTAKVWTIDRHDPVQSYEHEAPVLQTRWNPDAKSILTLSDDCVVSIYDVEKKKKIATIHDVPGTSSEYSHDGSMFAMGCNEGMLYVWDIRTQEMIRCQPRDDDRAAVVELTWSHDDKKIAAIYDDGKIHLFDMRMR